MQFKLLDESMARARAPCVASSIAVLLLGSIFSAWTPVAAQDSPFRTESVIAIDRIVVVVNDDVITDTELNARIAEVKRELRAKRIEPPSESVLRKQVLERMVLDRVQLQLADRTGVRVSNDAVDKAIRGIAERNRTDVDNLYRAVRREGIDLETYREQVRQEVAIQRLIDREIANRITVSDAEVDNFLANRQRRSRTDDTYNLSHILIGVPESATPDELRVARFRANQIYQSLKQGGNFEQAAIANSQGQYALQGGTLGWKESGQLPGMFLDVLEKMEPGDISEAVRSPAGFHILKLNDRRQGTDIQLVTQTHVRHILVRPSEVQSIAEVRAKLMQLRERVLGGDDFGELALAHSEDTSSAAKGGDLGWVSPGQTVPQFEKQMSRLELDEVSEPVQTPFGLHLIQVLARRQQDISAERDRTVARKQIRRRKADERYDQWLRRLRDEAYVKYQLEDEF